MAETQDLNEPWLVAVWPGMGNVALGAGLYLVQQLGAQPVSELEAREFFDVERIEVKDGVAQSAAMPQNRFFAWKDPEGRRDLLIFVGEAQPSTARYDFCHRLLDQATEYGISGIVTFAAMATQLHPTHEPRVFGVATRSSALKKLGDDVEVLEEGQISGLNGVFLAAAAERGFEGFCLLGELPFFAVGVPNPRASQAVLEVFTKVTGTELDFAPLQEQAEQSEQQLMELLERLNEETGSTGEETEQLEEDESETASDEERSELDAQQKNRIEKLFRQAQEDRSKAMELKQELDRLGVFTQYEDRFLDLFKRGE